MNHRFLMMNDEVQARQRRKAKRFWVRHWLSADIIVRSMTSISKGKNTPIVLKDEISLISKLINYAIFFRLSLHPKSVASYCKKGR